MQLWASKKNALIKFVAGEGFHDLVTSVGPSQLTMAMRAEKMHEERAAEWGLIYKASTKKSDSTDSWTVLTAKSWDAITVISSRLTAALQTQSTDEQHTAENKAVHQEHPGLPFLLLWSPKMYIFYHKV